MLLSCASQAAQERTSAACLGSQAPSVLLHARNQAELEFQETKHPVCVRGHARLAASGIPNMPHTDPLSYQTLSYEELKTVIKAEQYGTMIFIILFFLSKIIFCTSVLSLPFSNYILPPSTCKLHLNNLANLLRYIS